MNKKYLTFFAFFILLLVSFETKSQNIQFKCWLKSECTSDYIILDQYSLRKVDDQNTKTYLNEFAQLKDTGVYILKSYLIRDDSVFIHIPSFGLHIDTLLKQDLNEVVIVHSSKKPKHGDYYLCDKLFNGYIIEHYSNGNKKIEGNYKNGYPIKEFILYHMDGRIKSRSIFNKRGKLLHRTLY